MGVRHEGLVSKSAAKGSELFKEVQAGEKRAQRQAADYDRSIAGIGTEKSTDKGGKKRSSK